MATRIRKTLITTLACIAVQGLLCLTDTKAQERPFHTAIKTGADHLVIGSFKDSYNQRQFNSFALEWDFVTDQAAGNGSFASAFNWPVFGIGLNYNTLSDVQFKSKYGHYSDLISAYGTMSRDLIRTKHLGFGYNLMLGLSYSSGYYDPIDNRANWFFSSPILFYVAGGGHMTWMIGKRIDIEANINVRHNSSARFAYPNGGLNYWGGGLSARYHFQDRKAPKGHVFKPSHISTDMYEKGWSFEIYGGGGVHACAAEWLAYSKTVSKETLAETHLRKWPMASLNADAIYRPGGRFAAGFTINGFWNSNTDNLKWADSIIYDEEANAASKGYAPFSYGLGLVQEVFYNNLALYVQEGVYLYRRMGIHAEHGWLYERAGFRYYPEALKPFFISVCIKAHKFKADYMDFSFGVKF